MDDCVWLAVDKNGDGVLLSEMLLIRLDLRLAPDWYRQQMAQWPRDAIKHIEVLGLALQGYTTMNNTSNKLLTRQQLAKRLGVSPKTISRWWRAGKLPAPARCNVLRWREADIARWETRR